MKKYLFVLALILFGYMIGNESAFACDTAAVGYASCNAPAQQQFAAVQQQFVAVQPAYAVTQQVVAVQPAYAVGAYGNVGIGIEVGRDRGRVFRPVGRLPGRGGVHVGVGF